MKPANPLQIPSDELREWQSILDVLARVVDVPAALIMRIVESDIEVFVSSDSPGNPYKVGQRERLWGSGLYCETVIRERSHLLVDNALAHSAWKNNPDVELNMISYLGYPILDPDGEPFGTICVLDSKSNEYDSDRSELLRRMRDLVQHQLALVCMNTALSDKNRQLNDYITELRTLRQFVPICAWCQKVRQDGEYRQGLLDYLATRVDVHFTHGLCPECAKREF